MKFSQQSQGWALVRCWVVAVGIGTAVVLTPFTFGEEGCNGMLKASKWLATRRLDVALARFWESLRFSEGATFSTPFLENWKKLDTRKDLFYAEALLRLYARALKAADLEFEQTKKAQTEIKKIEDLLGAWVDWSKRRTVLSEKLPLQPSEKAWLDAHVAETETALTGLLEKMGLICADASGASYQICVHSGAEVYGFWPAVYEGFLSEVKELTSAKDRKWVLEALIDEVKDLDLESFDLNDLQGGIHELRRKLRWILIEVQALGGLVQVEGEAIPVRTPLFEGQEPCWIAKEVYSALGDAVSKLGDAKDSGELAEMVAQMTERTGGPRGMDRALLQRLQLPSDPIQAAKAQVALLEQKETLKKLKANLKKCRD